jgi:hypothetical protein
MDVSVDLPTELIEAAEREAARQGTTLARLVEAALRHMLNQAPPNSASFRIPILDLGRPRIDIANRDAVHDGLDEGD